MAAPDDDAGVVVQPINHVAQLLRRAPVEVVRFLVTPLQGEILPHQDAGLVAGGVQFVPVDVGMDADKIDVGPAQQIDVGSDHLGVVLTEPLGGDDIRPPGKKPPPVDAELPDVVYLDLPDAEPLAGNVHYLPVHDQRGLGAVERLVALVPRPPQRRLSHALDNDDLLRPRGQADRAGGL